MNKKTKEFREALAKEFVQCLQEEPREWKKMWSSAYAPMNGATGRRYNGLNQFFLQRHMNLRGISDPRFFTFHQIQDLSAKRMERGEEPYKLRKGSKGFQVEFWSFYDPVEKRKLTYKEAMELKEEGKDVRAMARYYHVFNGTDIEGLEEYKPKKISPDLKPSEVVDKIAQSMNITIRYGGDEAYYSQTFDRIQMPPADQFKTPEAFEATRLHELSHATGAKHRLNRDMGGGFGSESYAREELVAEISSCFTANALQFELDDEHFENHKAYIQSWIRAIEEKPETLFAAIKDANMAADFLEKAAGLEKEKEQDKEQTQNKKKDVFDPKIQPIVTILWSESNKLKDGEKMTFAQANTTFAGLDEVKHAEGKGYDKTKFRIDFTLNGKLDSYEGRQDFGDGDGSLIDHIRDYHLYYEDNEEHKRFVVENYGAEAWEKEDSERNHVLTEFIPYLEMHSSLYTMEQNAHDALKSSGSLSSNEQQYYNAVLDYVDTCREKINNGEYTLSKAPQMMEEKETNITAEQILKDVYNARMSELSQQYREQTQGIDVSFPETDNEIEM